MIGSLVESIFLSHKVYMTSICLNPILKSPVLSALVAGCSVMLYFALMSYSPSLPPALICSLAAAYFVYFMMGGKVLCDEAPTPQQVTTTVPSAIATIPAATVPRPVPALPSASVLTEAKGETNLVNPSGTPISAFRIL